ncbi:hypothetical protein [Methylobacter psychrophilus]|uniref:hypothetical protein n=1 Tax=Methylobacter psychrophilus TaxID=96941 RepID=UPI0021D4AD80|nr:hypothetical protein [Methylobacter psychrophilus]
MTEEKNDTINKLGEEDLEFKRFANRGNKLKWTWIIGVLVIVVSLLYGDTAQLLLAAFAAVYIAITTINYFKCVRKLG